MWLGVLQGQVVLVGDFEKNISQFGVIFFCNIYHDPIAILISRVWKHFVRNDWNILYQAAISNFSFPTSNHWKNMFGSSQEPRSDCCNPKASAAPCGSLEVCPFEFAAGYRRSQGAAPCNTFHMIRTGSDNKRSIDHGMLCFLCSGYWLFMGINSQNTIVGFFTYNEPSIKTLDSLLQVDSYGDLTQKIEFGSETVKSFESFCKAYGIKWT